MKVNIISEVRYTNEVYSFPFSGWLTRFFPCACIFSSLVFIYLCLISKSEAIQFKGQWCIYKEKQITGIHIINFIFTAFFLGTFFFKPTNIFTSCTSSILCSTKNINVGLHCLNEIGWNVTWYNYCWFKIIGWQNLIW